MGFLEDDAKITNKEKLLWWIIGITAVSLEIIYLFGVRC